VKDIFGVFRVVSEEWLDFFVFCFANLFFGAMALWVPPVIAAMNDGVSLGCEFTEALRRGHGYFYALAILSASFPYWLREFKSAKETAFFSLKLGTGIFSGLIIVVCALFVSVLVNNGMHHADTQAATMRTWPLYAEMLLTIVAFALTAYLFCLEHIDKYPEYGKALRDREVKRIVHEMDGATSRSGMNLEG